MTAGRQEKDSGTIEWTRGDRISRQYEIQMLYTIDTFIFITNVSQIYLGEVIFIISPDHHLKY